MTLKEAFAELGTEPSATRGEVRRAYFRALKTRSPEKDPEGFKRLRQAYELVDHLLAAGARFVVVEDEKQDGEPEPDEAEVTEAAPPPPSFGPASEPAPEPAPEPAKAEGPPAPTWASLAAAFDAAAASVQIPSPPPGLGLDMLLRLIEAGDLEGAAALRRSLDSWMTAHGEARALNGQGVVVWQLVQELLSAAPWLSAEGRVALVRAIRARDLRRERPGLRRAVGDIGANVRVNAPMIAKALSAPPRPPRQRSSMGGLAFLVIPAILGLLRLISSSRPPLPQVVDLPSVSAPTPHPDFDRVRDAALELMRTRQDGATADIRDASGWIADAAVHRDCTLMGSESARVHRSSDALLAVDGYQELTMAVINLDAAIAIACPPHP